MIVVSNKPGQLANLLFVYASVLSYALEKHVTLINPAFHDYRSYFRLTSDTWWCTRPVYQFCYLTARVLVRLRIRNRWLNYIALDNGENVDLEKCQEPNSRLCFLQGWGIRADRLFFIHQQAIRDFFVPAPRFSVQLEHFFARHFQSSDTIIGIHIRQGDYRHFENGKYFYSIGQYAGLMRNALDLFSGKNIHFLVCSNSEHQIEADLPGLRITRGPGHELLDLYALSRCHYLIGPPSTYSMWASFFGNVPLCMVHNPNTSFLLSDFKPFQPL